MSNDNDTWGINYGDSEDVISLNNTTKNRTIRKTHLIWKDLKLENTLYIDCGTSHTSNLKHNSVSDIDKADSSDTENSLSRYISTKENFHESKDLFCENEDNRADFFSDKENNVFDTTSEESKNDSSLYPIKPNEEVSTELSENISPPKKVNKVIPYDLAESIKDSGEFVVFNNTVYIYEANYGYYRSLYDGELQNQLRTRFPKELKRKINSSILIEVIKWLKTFKDIQTDLYSSGNYINFANGYYNIYKDKFKTKNRESKNFTYYVDALFNPNDNDGSVFERYIDDITEGDYEFRLLLQEVIGVAISDIRSFKKAFFIVGSADSGKSTFLDLINNLIGHKFTSNLSLSDLNDKFRLAELADKRLNTCGEISEYALKRLDIFKSITGNDTLLCERKGKDPFTFRNKAILIFAGNSLPELSVADAANAFFKRMIIIPFNNTVSEDKKDPFLLQKLLYEKSYITNFALEGLRRFIDNNYEFTECTIAKSIRQDYLYENASVQMFIKECCTLSPSDKETSNDLLITYEDFCYEKGVTPLSSKAFHKQLKNLPNVKRGRFRTSEGNLWGYKGIKLTI